MERGKDKALKISKAGLKSVLRRIFTDPTDNTGTPFLLLKDGAVKLKLADVIKLIIQTPDVDDREIVARSGISGLRPTDVMIARAYIHRFGSDVERPLKIDDHPVHTLLLDENLPQPAMLSLSKSFGWATHVAAEGLAGRGTPDENIWEFALREKFQAIVTRDADFLEIQKRRALAAMKDGMGFPLLIFVKDNTNTPSLTDIFSSYKSAIEYHISRRSCLAIGVSHTSYLNPLF